VLLAWIVLWKLDAPYIGAAALLPRPIKLVPFVATADAGASAPVEVAINLVQFVPFGLYLGLLAPAWPLWRKVAVLFGASLLLEIAKHVLSIGSFDSTDVLVNTAGGLLGLGLLTLVRRTLRLRTPPVLTRVCPVGTVLAVLAVALFIASPLHYAQQHDVVVTR
jgi:glycopeptide antibiotics resistance protein